jgi:hypothetical protein
VGYFEDGFEEGEVIQLGLNGKPISSSSSGSNVFVSSRPKIRLDGPMPIDHQLVKRFVSQVRNDNFSQEIERLIDPFSWKQII